MPCCRPHRFISHTVSSQPTKIFHFQLVDDRPFISRQLHPLPKQALLASRPRPFLLKPIPLSPKGISRQRDPSPALLKQIFFGQIELLPDVLLSELP